MRVSAEILSGEESESILRASRALLDGDLIGMPTETVYGLACNALDPVAVARVFDAKGRPGFDPLIVHTRDLDHARSLARFCPLAEQLARRFWPGPLTLVLPRRDQPAGGGPVVPDLVTAGLPRVGLRVPDHPIAQSLLHESGLALAAPSANRFGAVSPTTAGHVAEELGDKLRLILDGGPCRRGVESTVVAFEPQAAERDLSTSQGLVILRQGAVTAEDLREALPQTPITAAVPTSRPGTAARSSNDTQARPAPGMTDRHYAPATPLYLYAPGPDAPPTPRTQQERWGLMAIGDAVLDTAGFAESRNLSRNGDLCEAASNLFQVMRELDGLGLDGIVAIGAPERGIGRAINDRLRRAAASA